MEFTEKVSALIFVLIFMGAVVYVIMARFVTGPLSRLQRGEQIILIVSFIGILLVLVYAAVELLFHIVF